MARTKFPKDQQADEKLKKNKEKKAHKKHKPSKTEKGSIDKGRSGEPRVSPSPAAKASQQITPHPKTVPSSSSQPKAANPIPVQKKDKKEKHSKKRKLKSGMLALKEIKKYQKTTELQIPREPFRRLVKETLYDINNGVNRIKKTAVFAIQEATEQFVTELLGDTLRIALHAKRVTIDPKDLRLAYFFLQKHTNP